MSGHTKAPLSGKSVKVCFVEFEKLGITVSIPQYADAEAKANSRRMIACFEALEGLTTEQIEDGVFQKMSEERDFLASEVDALTKQRNDLLDAMRQTLAMLRVTSHGPSAANKAEDMLHAAICSLGSDHFHDAAKMVQDWWQLVPVEPTSEMLLAAAGEVHSATYWRSAYRAMLSSAPKLGGEL